MNDNDRISIIIPIYNQEKFLCQCIDSVLYQTFSNLQIILVDDGSTDSSFAICKSYEEKDDRIEVYTKENQGVSSARNFGLKKAKGEWVMYVDADDWIERDACQKLLDAAFVEDADIVDGSVVKEFKNKSILDSLGNDRIQIVTDGAEDAKQLVKSVFYYKNQVNNNTVLLGPYAKLIKKRLIDEYKISFPYGIKMGEDQLHNIDLFLASKKHIWRDCIVYHYRIHSQSQMQQTNKDIFDKQLDFLNELYKKKPFDVPESVWDVRVVKTFLLCINTVKFKNYNDFLVSMRVYINQGLFKSSFDRIRTNYNQYDISGKFAGPMVRCIAYKHYFILWVLLYIKKVAKYLLGINPS